MVPFLSAESIEEASEVQKEGKRSIDAGKLYCRYFEDGLILSVLIIFFMVCGGPFGIEMYSLFLNNRYDN